MIPLGAIRGTVYILLPLAIVFFQNVGADDPRRILIIIAIALGSMIISFSYQALNWFFYTYRFEEGYLHVKSGVIIKNERSIKQERVQTVNIRRGIIQQLLGLASLQVETAGAGGESEFNLTAVAYEEAVQIKKSLEGPGKAPPQEIGEVAKDDDLTEGEAGEPSFTEHTISIPELFIAGATSGRFLLLFSILAAIFSQVVPFIPENFWETLIDQVTSTALVTVILVGLVLLLFSWLTSTVAYVIQYINFTVRREEERLQVTWGLIVQKQLTLKLHRLQALVVQEELLRQPIGRVALAAEVAGGGSKEQDYVTILFPLLRKKNLPEFLESILPEHSLPESFKPLPRRSLRRYLFRALAPLLLISIAMLWLPYGYGWLTFFLLIPAFFWGLSRYRAGGTFIEENKIALRFRFINRYTVLTMRSNIQAMQVSVNPFQRRQDLKTLRAWVLSSPEGKQFQVVDVESAEAKSIWNWFSRY